MTGSALSDVVFSLASNVLVTDGVISGGQNGVLFGNGQDDRATKLMVINSSSVNIRLFYEVDGVVSSNQLNGPNIGIESIDGAGNAISLNTITGIAANGNGAYTSGDTHDIISKNTVAAFASTTNSFGFFDFQSSGNTFSGNTDNGGTGGLYLDEDSVGYVAVTGNTVKNAAENGFVALNAYNGLADEPPYSTFTKNTAVNNGADGFFGVRDYGSTWSGNTATANDFYGFELSGPYEYTIKGNTATFNANAGFSLENDGPEYAFSSFTGNTANTNYNYGFDSDYAVVLGSGNKAKGNTPLDCFHVTCPPGSTSASSTNR